MDDEGSQSSNVKGKGPETSASATSPDVSSRPEPRVFGTMQSEPPPQGRLGSVKTERMTLGGATKMKFKPTIPTKRNKKEGAPSLLEDTMSKAKDESADHGRGRGRNRGRGRGRDRVEEVVASGPFSLGPAALNSKSTKPHYMSGGGGSGSGGSGGSGSGRGNSNAGGTKEVSTSSSMAALTLDGSDVKIIESIAVDEESGDLEMQFGDGTDPWAPVTLPRESQTGHVAKVKKEKEKLKQARNQRMQDDNDYVKKEIKVKDEPMVENAPSYDDLPDDEDDILDDLAAKILEGANEAFDSINHNTSDDHLLFFQFPAILPKFGTEDSESSAVKVDLDPNAEASTAGQTTDSATNVDVKEEKNKETLIQNEPEGRVGKLLVYKSGKVKIRFGEVLFEVYPGSNVSFLENVVVVDPNAKQAFVMGNVSKHFVCVPDMSCLLKN